MFEAIKLFVEIIRAAMPKIASARRAKKITTIGASLLLVYVRGNEVAASARRIIDSLDNYMDTVENGSERDRANAEGTTSGYLYTEVRQQHHDVCDLLNMMDNLRIELQIVGGPVYNALSRFYFAKSTRLEELMDILGRGALPLVPAIEDMPDDEPNHNVDAVSFSRPLNNADFEAISRYFSAHDPRAQLSDMESALAELRTTLLENFSLHDVLLAVGDTDSPFRSAPPEDQYDQLRRFDT